MYRSGFSAFCRMGKKTPFDFLQDGGVVINHPAVHANLDRRIGDEKVFPLVAVKVFDLAPLVAVTAADIAAGISHLIFPSRASMDL